MVTVRPRSFNIERQDKDIPSEDTICVISEILGRLAGLKPSLDLANQIADELVNRLRVKVEVKEL